MNIDEKYMHRALQLAALGNGSVSPNPMVGAVIVHNGKIIGEGYHRQIGKAHAEVNAVNSVKECDQDKFKESTIYVTLEPCSHYGKTPPCSKLLIEKGIKRVVVGCLDPFKEVSGRGIKMLKEAGCEVVTGVLEKECKAMNKKFMTAHTLQRPYILLKWAESMDGFIDKKRENGATATPVSSSVTSVFVHKLRTEYDAIMVGGNTALLDNPSLTTRLWHGRNPKRVVVWRNHPIDSNLKLLQDGLETEVINTKGQDLQEVMHGLYNRGITSIIIEGGAKLLQSFLEIELFDEIRVEIGKVPFFDGTKAPILPQNVKLVHEETFGFQRILTYEP